MDVPLLESTENFSGIGKDTKKEKCTSVKVETRRNACMNFDTMDLIDCEEAS